MKVILFSNFGARCIQGAVRSGRRALVPVLIAVALVAAPITGATAQTGGVTITFTPNTCVSDNYPEVVCIVTAIDAKGVPYDKLTQSQFDAALDNGQPVTELKVTPRSNPNVVANYVLILDLGATAPGLDIEALKSASKSILTDLAPEDQAAMIGITGKIDLGDTVNPPIDKSKEIGFVKAGPSRNEVINLITTLQRTGNTPLYDAVCKALILAARQNVGSRAIFVISDGRDITSSACVKPEDPINRAATDKTPIYAIGVGANLTEDYLKRLTLGTGGLYLGKATDGATIEAKFKDVQTLLKSQYEVRFKSSLASDGQAHGIKVGVTLPSGRAEGTSRFIALAGLVPELRKLVYKIGDREIAPNELVTDRGDLVIEPEIAARKVARVEYDIGGETFTYDTQPFSARIPIAKFKPGVDTKLVVRVIGDAKDPKTVSTREETLLVKPLAVPTAVPTPRPTPTPPPLFPPQPGSPIFWAMIALGLLLLLFLGLLLIGLSRRRRAPPPVEYQVPETGIFSAGGTESFPVSGSATPSYDATSVSPIVQQHTAIFGVTPGAGDQSSDSGKTAIMGLGGTSVMEGAGKTMIFTPGKAMLEITSGELMGQRFSLGGSLSQLVAIGREVTGGTDIKFTPKSAFVSRRHAEIKYQDDKLYLTDLGSSSGSKLNGTRLTANTPTEIKIGDKIEIADIKAEVKEP